MSPYAHVVVHFSSLTFSPYSALTAFESHVMAFSPDGGFISGALVVVATAVVVVASGVAMEVSDGDEVEHALVITAIKPRPSSSFIKRNVSALVWG